MHVNSVVALGSVLYDSALVCCLKFRQHIEATFPKENTMAYTLKRPIAGLSFEDIKRIYDNNPNMTLSELSNITGYAIPFLKRLLTSS